MLEGLTQTQQWGIAYLLQLYNAESERYNATVGERNRFLPRDQPLLEVRPLLDEEAYVVKRIAEIADQGYQQLIAYKEQEALRIFRSRPLDEQEALLVQLKVPDVLKKKG